MLNEFKNIKSTKKELREFGVVVGAVLIAIGDLALLKGRSHSWFFLGFGGALFFLGVMLPSVLKPLQKVWMGLAVVMGFFMSRLVLTALFYIVVTPIGLIMRIMGKDVLDQKIEKGRTSYWYKRPSAAKPKASYENQY